MRKAMLGLFLVVPLAWAGAVFSAEAPPARQQGIGGTVKVQANSVMRLPKRAQELRLRRVEIGEDAALLIPLEVSVLRIEELHMAKNARIGVAPGFLGQFLSDEERYTDAGLQPVGDDPHQIQRDALERLQGLIQEHMSDERLLLTWFGQFMTEPRYPELVAGEEIPEEELFGALEDGALLVRNPSARLAWSEIDIGLVLFASGQSVLLPGQLKELLKLVCSADALHLENLGQWLADDDARKLLAELVKQGSLEFADE